MATYRIHRQLHVGKSKFLMPGSMSNLQWLNQEGIDILSERGVISRVQPPPLIALPGWQTRARKIDEVTGGQVQDAEQFLEADNQYISDLMQVQLKTVEKWKREVEDWLTIKPGEQNR